MIKLNQPEIWNNPDYAQELTKQAASLRQTVEPWQTLTVQVSDMVELMELGDDDLLRNSKRKLRQLKRVLIGIKPICCSPANMTIVRQLCAFRWRGRAGCAGFCDDVGANVFALGGKVWNEG